MKENFLGLNWILLKAYYNGTENEIPLTFHGDHYYLDKSPSIAVTGSWGIALSSSTRRLFSPWSAIYNNVGEIAFTYNPDEVIFDGVTF